MNSFSPTLKDKRVDHSSDKQKDILFLKKDNERLYGFLQKKGLYLEYIEFAREENNREG